MPEPRVPEEAPHGGPAYGVVPGPVRPGGPASPGWLADPPPRVTIKANGGVARVGTGPKMLPTLSKVVTGFTMIGLLWGIDHWARPTLKASKIEQRNGIWGWLHTFLYSAQDFLRHGTNVIAHPLSKGAAHAAAGPAHTLDLFALRWEQLIWNFAYFAHDTADVIGQIVLHAIPHAVGTAVHPVKLEVKKLRKGVIVIVEEITTVKRYFKHVIVREIRPQIHHLTTIVTVRLPTEIRTVKKQATRTEIQVRQQGKIIVKLLPLLTIAGAVGLVLKAFTRLGLNYTRCENVKNIGNELCASPPGSGRKLGRFLRGILSGLGGLLAPLFVCQLFEAAVVLVAPLMSTVVEVIGFAGSALCNGKHHAAPPLTLNAVALPPVNNPLPL